MKCPRCGLLVTDAAPRCAGCAFTLGELDEIAGAPPARDGPLVDLAGRLSQEERDELVAALEDAAAAVHGELCVVLTERAPLPPPQWAFWLFNRWQVGGDAHAGALVVVAFAERRVDCEVGYAWEDVLDEEATGDVLDEHVVPALAEGRVADGVRAGVAAITERLRGAMEAA